jgi:hypothetical protein
MKEAGEHIAFALDERLALWNIWNKGIIQTLLSLWVQVG